MDKNMENEMETGIIREFIGVRVYISYNPKSLKGVILYRGLL